MSNSVSFVPKWVESPEITAILPRLRQMPTMPEANKRVLNLLADPDVLTDRIADEIRRDVGLTAQLVKLVNSAVFAPSEPISNVSEAVNMIGLVRLKALVSTAWAFHLIDERKACPGFSPNSEWSHAVTVAMEACRLAERVGGSTELQEAAFTAGMLHDLGKILLAVNVPEYFMAAKEAAESSALPFWQGEAVVLGFNHAELGGRLLTFWGMPNPVIEAVGWHHEPHLAPMRGVSPLTLVHLANCGAHQVAPDSGCEEAYRTLQSAQGGKGRLR